MNRISRLATGILLVAGIASGAAGGPNVAYTKSWVERVPAHVVTVNLNSLSVRVSPAVARYGIGTSEGFGSMLSRLHPSAAITGTFFCVRTLHPVGDIVIDGSRVNIGSTGTAVCFTGYNNVEFLSTNLMREVGWDRYPSVLCTGPRIVKNSFVHMTPMEEGFSSGAHFRTAPRAALGVTRWNKLLLVTVNRPIHLSHLARIMRSLGAIDAVGLDGGSSTALFCKGRVLSHPSRRLTNVLVVYESPAAFDYARPLLTPVTVVSGNPTRF